MLHASLLVEAVERNEVIPVVRDDASTVLRRVLDLRKISRCPQLDLIGADYVHPGAARNACDPPGEVCVQVEAHQRRGGRLLGFRSHTSSTRAFRSNSSRSSTTAVFFS